MLKTIELIDENGNTINVPMRSNAGTAIRYRGVFHEEIPVTGDKNMLYLAIMANEKIDIGKEEDLTRVASITQKATDKIIRLAFIMAMSGAGKQMDKLSYEDFVSWSETLDSASFTEEKQSEIWALYTGNSESSSESKKKNVEQAET